MHKWAQRHSESGKKSGTRPWACSVGDDLRVLLRWDGDAAFIVNLGSHDGAYWTRRQWSCAASAL